jgi:signal transduction histidine kinase
MATQAAVAALLVAQMAVAAWRLPHAPRRAEGAWFIAFLGGLLGLALTTRTAPGGLLALSLLLWVAGAYLTARDGERPPAAWHVSAAGVALVVLVCALLGWWRDYRWCIPLAVVLAQVVYPRRRLCGRRHLRKGTPDRYLCFAGLLPVTGAVADQVVPLAGRPAPALAAVGVGLLALGSGYFLTQLGYLQGAAGAAGAGPPARRLARLRRRVHAAEENLLLQNRLETVGYLAAGVAHEVKNLLGHIKTTAEYGLQADSPDQRRRALQLILHHVGIGVGGVNEMLDTVLRGGPETPGEVRILAELEPVLAVLVPSLRAVGVRVELRIPAELAAVTRKRELMLALLNLVQNAAQITAERRPHGGVVTVQGSAGGGRCVLEVTDLAGGMEPEVAAHLFDWGYSTGAGTGLGLHLARRLIERNGGRLSYRAIAGGSCFRIELAGADT